MFARLDHIQLLSSAPEKLLTFYQDMLGMSAEQIDHDHWLCQGPQRCLLIGRKTSQGLGFSAYQCANSADLSSLKDRLLNRQVPLAPSASPLFSAEAFSFFDPDGNCVVFGTTRRQAKQGTGAREIPSLTARLQHVAVATTQAEPLLHFYSDIVGLALSDQMLDGTQLGACWLRAPEDTEHHSLALFRAEKNGLDHYSYELDDWNGMRDWADHFASKGLKLFWGPGRHGPGNNLFLFVLDPDGNKVELSAELETMYEGRPTGTWPHEPDTLNRWGQSFMRS